MGQAAYPLRAPESDTLGRPVVRGLCSLAASLGMFVFYSAVGVWLTWPLAERATTDLPSPTFFAADIITATWLLAWHTHSITTHPSLLVHPNAFHPTRFALFYAPPALAPLPIFGPAYLASQSASVAYTTAFLGGLALAGLSVAIVVRRWTRSTAAGWIAGTVLVTSPAVWQSPGTAPLCAMLAALPWLVDAGARRHLPTRRVGVIVGALTIQALADPLFALAAAALPLCILAAVRLARPATRPTGLRLAGSVLLALVVLSPLLLGYLLTWLHLDPERASPWAVLTLVIMAQQPAPSGVGIAWPVTSVAALGMLLAARRGTLRRPGWRNAALWSAVGLSYPLVLFPVFERLVTARPDLLYLAMPFRSFGRLTNDLLATAPLLVGLAAAEFLHLLDRVPRCTKVARALGAVVAVALLLMSGAPTNPYRTIPVPQLPSEVHELVVRRGGPVLELPVSGPAAHANAMYHSIGGWWDVVNGYASFWPPGFASRMDDAMALPDPVALRRLIAETGVATIVVNLARMGTTRPRWESTVDPERAGLRRLWQSRTHIVFAVDDVPMASKQSDVPASGMLASAHRHHGQRGLCTPLALVQRAS